MIKVREIVGRDPKILAVAKVHLAKARPVRKNRAHQPQTLFLCVPPHAVDDGPILRGVLRRRKEGRGQIFPCRAPWHLVDIGEIEEAAPVHAREQPQPLYGQGQQAAARHGGSDPRRPIAEPLRILVRGSNLGGEKTRKVKSARALGHR